VYRLIGVAGLVLALSATPSTTDQDLANQAEAALHAGMEARQSPATAGPLFREAAESYESLRQRGWENGALYRNQGAAYFLAGELPRAILAFRRGLRLAPADAILQADLEHARTQVAYPEGTAFGRPQPTASVGIWISPTVFAALLIVIFLVYTIGWLGVARWRMVRRPGPLRLAVGAFSAVVLLAGLLTLQTVAIRDEMQHPLVVIADDGVLLRRGNGLSYPPRYETPLNRGVEARLLSRRRDWLQIELGSGEVGWIPRAYALIDEPDA
jgi:hypothetical protein